jgi:GrpB-like predicted nucleotidyltransferase (UPF0157 family)
MLVEPHHDLGLARLGDRSRRDQPPPQLNWHEQAAELRLSLLAQLASWQVTDVHHVGSTAVPGLAAKPILDLMAATADLDDAEMIATQLQHSGWHYVPPELDAQPWRRFFVHVVDDRRHAHLHLMQLSTPRWQQQLTFRDRLRDDADLREQYGNLKQELARTHSADREAYSHAKTAFITKVIGERSE